MDRPIFHRRFGIGLSGWCQSIGEHRSEWAAICSIVEEFGCSSENVV